MHYTALLLQLKTCSEPLLAFLNMWRGLQVGELTVWAGTSVGAGENWVFPNPFFPHQASGCSSQIFPPWCLFCLCSKGSNFLIQRHRVLSRNVTSSLQDSMGKEILLFYNFLWVPCVDEKGGMGHSLCCNLFLLVGKSVLWPRQKVAQSWKFGGEHPRVFPLSSIRRRWQTETLILLFPSCSLSLDPMMSHLGPSHSPNAPWCVVEAPK